MPRREVDNGGVGGNLPPVDLDGKRHVIELIVHLEPDVREGPSNAPSSTDRDCGEVRSLSVSRRKVDPSILCTAKEKSLE